MRRPATAEERSRATILTFFAEVMGKGDLDALDELASEDYRDYVALPDQGPGRAGLKRRVATIRAAFEPRQQLHHVVVDGDRVAVRWTLRGVHSGPFLGLAPTGRSVQFDGVDVYVMNNGRMAAHWNVVDLWAFYQQAGGRMGLALTRALKTEIGDWRLRARWGRTLL